MDENKKKNNYMINSCLGKRPKVESMGNYMAIICFKKTRARRRKETLATEGTQELPRISHELSLILNMNENKIII